MKKLIIGAVILTGLTILIKRQEITDTLKVLTMDSAEQLLEDIQRQAYEEAK